MSYRSRWATLCCTGFALACLPAGALPEDLAFFTDFETISTSTGQAFVVGVPPSSQATFSGDAFSGFAGIAELYHSGLSAWMVNPNGTGAIDFQVNASEVQFWARLRSGANGSTVYTAFDDANGVIDSVAINSPGSFQLLTFTGDIDRIEVVNNATGSGQMNSIDDFGFTPVPEPTTAGLVGLAGLVMLRRRRL